MYTYISLKGRNFINLLQGLLFHSKSSLSEDHLRWRYFFFWKPISMWDHFTVRWNKLLSKVFLFYFLNENQEKTTVYQKITSGSLSQCETISQVQWNRLLNKGIFILFFKRKSRNKLRWNGEIFQKSRFYNFSILTESAEQIHGEIHLREFTYV